MRTMRHPIVGLLAPLALLGLLASGCSDDEEALSEDEFVEQANAICDAENEELDEAGDELFGSEEEPSDEDFAAFAELFEDGGNEQVDAIEALNGPSDLEDELEPVLDDVRELIEEVADQIREDPEALFAGDDPFADVDEQLTELGLTSCASDD